MNHFVYQLLEKFGWRYGIQYVEKHFWIVSHGGCGTALFNGCVNPGLVAPMSLLRHPPYPIDEWKKKYVYIFGDLINSIVSQEIREILYHNSTFIKYGEFLIDISIDPAQRLSIKNRKNLNTEDPLGIENQFWHFYKSKRKDIIMLKYPFTIDSLGVVNDFLGGCLNIHYPKYNFQRRTRVSIEGLKSLSKPGIFEKILLKYIPLAEYFDSLPDVIIKEK